MSSNSNKRKMLKKAFTVGLLLLAVSPMFAGAGALGTAATEVKSYLGNLIVLIKAVGIVVGVIGALRIYNKWSNGDQDINKEVVGWGGACLFLILAPDFIQAIFA